MGLGVLVAAVSFVLLASAARTSQLRVRGVVAANFRSSYDILVRPRAAATGLERRDGLVRDNYLAGTYGGISFAEYRLIEHLRGVQVAAPIANIGYLMPLSSVWLPVNRYLDRQPFQVYRLSLQWVADDGLSRYPAGQEYVYYTRRDRIVDPLACSASGCEPQGVEEVTPSGRRLPVCNGFGESNPGGYGPFDLLASAYLTCFSARSPTQNPNQFLGSGGPVPPRGLVGSGITAYLPEFMSAIDPRAEARLVGLNRAIVSGRYLRESDRVHVVTRNGFEEPTVPVIASDRTYVGDRLAVTVERLVVPRRSGLPAILASGGCRINPSTPGCVLQSPKPVDYSREIAYPFLTHLRGLPVGRYSVSANTAYDHGRSVANGGPYWTTSPTRYRILGRNSIRPLTVRRDPISTWVSSADISTGGFITPPFDNRDVQFRGLFEHSENNRVDGNLDQFPSLDVVGTYDPSKLPGFSPLSRVPLETYYPPTLVGADDRSRRLLHDRALGPSQNLGGYIQQPPLILTTLAGMQAFLNSNYFQGVSPQELRAPISAIRIRVSDVHGDDALSQARIRLVAQEIHQATGLVVDITAGSSPTPITVDLPGGRYGRPALLLHEGWTRKGVAVSYLNAVDQKSLLLLALILIVCGLFLANSVLAAMKARRQEVGTLMTFGWARRQIARLFLAELAATGLVAGVAGALLAVAVVRLLSLSLSTTDALMVIPVAIAMTLLAGGIPVALSVRQTPTAALRPAVADTGRGFGVSGIVRMAVVNLIRVPVRTVLAGGGLAIGVAACAVVVGIEQAFAGQLVTSVLGDAIAVQIRGVDELAVVLTIALAGLSLADVVSLNLAERRGELATLRTFGWAPRHVRRLIIAETIAIGVAGSTAGAVLGLAIGATLLGLPLSATLLGAGAAALIGVAAALLVSVWPVIRLERLPASAILAQDA